MGRSEDWKKGVAQDERFSAMFKDPRFQRFPKKKHKIVIDQRFSGLLQDEVFKVTTVVDKRGRKVAKKRDNNDLKRYYRLKDEEEWRKDADAAEPQDAAAGAEVVKADQADIGKDSQPPAKAATKQCKDTSAVDKVEAQQKAKQKQGIATEKPQQVQQSQKGRQPKQAQQPQRGPKCSNEQAEGSQVAGPAVAASLEEEHEDDYEDAAASEADDEDKSEDGSGDRELSAGKSDKAYMWARARGLAGPSSSEEHSSENEEGDQDEDEDEGLDSADEPLTDEEGFSERSMDLEEWGVGAYARNPDMDATLVPLEHDTRRLAIVDLDWDHVKAVDILAVLRSFCPRSGQVERVTVYPSDYGLQRLAEETVAGPLGIYKARTTAASNGNGAVPAADEDDESGSADGDEDDSADRIAANSSDDSQNASEGGHEEADSDDDGLEIDADGGLDSDELHAGTYSENGDDDGRDNDDDLDRMQNGKGRAGRDNRGERAREIAGKGKGQGRKREHQMMLHDAGDDGEADGAEVDKVRLAMYERSKMRYYYAVAECDSVATASGVYAECDGLEFERSACRFDLRFVPDEQSFEGRVVRDTATSIPDGYKPPNIFNTSLQHTDPKLTWDADDDGRKRVLSKRLTEQELKDADFAAYLGSDDSAQEEEEDAGAERKDAVAIRKKYQSLLVGSSGGDNTAQRAGRKSWGDNEGSGEGSSGQGEEEEEDVAGATGTSRIRNEDGMEMEITFKPGLESLGQRLLDKKQEEAQRKGETVWEAYLRKKREKKLKKKMDRKSKATGSSSDDDSDGAPGSDDDMYANDGNGHMGADPFFQHEESVFDAKFFTDNDAADNRATGEEMNTARDLASKKKKEGNGKADKSIKQQEKGKEQKQQKELELLLMDDSALHEVARGRLGLIGAAARGATNEDRREEGPVNKGKLSKKEKRKQKQQAKQRAREVSDEEELQDDGFQANYSDPRFADVLASHDFALDPTDPKFRKFKGVQTLMEASKKLGRSGHKPAGSASTNGKEKGEGRGERDAAGNREELELRAMVAKLKRKAAQMQGAGQAGAETGSTKPQKRRAV